MPIQSFRLKGSKGFEEVRQVKFGEQSLREDVRMSLRSLPLDLDWLSDVEAHCFVDLALGG